jgi:hypothetical protein
MNDAFIGPPWFSPDSPFEPFQICHEARAELKEFIAAWLFSG